MSFCARPTLRMRNTIELTHPLAQGRPRQRCAAVNNTTPFRGWVSMGVKANVSYWNRHKFQQIATLTSASSWFTFALIINSNSMCSKFPIDRKTLRLTIRNFISCLFDSFKRKWVIRPQLEISWQHLIPSVKCHNLNLICPSYWSVMYDLPLPKSTQGKY